MQIPELAIVVLGLMLVRQWLAFPSWLTWAIIGICIAKDIIFYPFTWRAYEWGYTEEKSPMTGLRGIVKDRLNPSGYIIVRGELWKARGIKDEGIIEEGEHVIVRSIKGLTLFVERENIGKNIEH